MCKGVGERERERERQREQAGSCMTDREYPTLHTAQLGGSRKRVTLLRGTVEKGKMVQYFSEKLFLFDDF